MNELMKYLGDANKPVAVATENNGQAEVRFMSFKMVEDGNLYFLTSKKKTVFKSLEKNPRVQICTLPDEEGNWVRLNAKIVFSEDLELKKKSFEILPILEKAYQTPENPDIVLLQLTEIEATKSSLGGKSEKLV